MPAARKLCAISLFACLALAATACEITTTDADDDDDDADTTELTTFRFIALSPDAPAVDFCLAEYGSDTFSEPVIASVAEQLYLDGSGGLSFGEASIYMTLPPDQYVVRVIPAGQDDCDTYLMTDTLLNWFGEDELHTVALVGDYSVVDDDPDLSLVVFEDDDSGTSSYTKLRFVHAAPGLPEMDFGLGTAEGDDYEVLYEDVAFGSVGAYSLLDTVTSQEFEAHESDDTDFNVITASATLTSGALQTVFLVGGKTDDDDVPAHMLMCEDKAGEGYLGTCYVVSD